MTNSSSTFLRSGFRPETIVVLGVSTSGADGAGGRELALGPDAVVEVRRRMSDLHPDLEHVIIATCDRTELVLASHQGIDVRRALSVWHEALGVAFAGSDAPCLASVARPFVSTGVEAVEHLLHVACGLKSSLLGDADVLGQLRTAWHDAEAADVTGPVTRTVFRDAFAVGRRARSTSDISAGGAGVGSAVAAAVASCTGPILIVGAGPAARTIARRLAKAAPSPITIVNRTAERADQLADEIGGRSVAMSSLDAALLDAEVVVAAVAAPRAVLSSQRLIDLRRARPDWSPTIIDVGAPANVEPTNGFDIVTLDGLAQRATSTSARRQAAVPVVEQIIAEIIERRYEHPSPIRGAVTTHLADTPSADTARRK
jgi:glutamyl-tRNA reductase